MKRVIVLGAGGRDFHDFAMVFRDDPDVRVVAFTAAQIPGIDDRRFPASLAGPTYPEGIAIRPQAELTQLIRAHQVDEVVLAYSDLAYADVMHLCGGDGGGRRLPTARARRDDASFGQTRGRHLCVAYGCRQVPDHPTRRSNPARRRAPSRLGASPDAGHHPVRC